MASKNGLLIPFLIFTVLCQLSCKTTKTDTPTKKYAPASLKNDVSVLEKVSACMHPVYGIYHSRHFYDSLFRSFSGSLTDSLTEKQFRIKLKLVAGNLRCGHTEIIASKKTIKHLRKKKFNFSPYLFMPVGDTLYMAAALNKKDSLIKKGARITKINGIPADSIIRYSRRFISTDGFNKTMPEYYIQWNFNPFYLSLFGRPDTFNVEYSSGNKIQKIHYPAIRLKQLPVVIKNPISDSSYIKLKRAKCFYNSVGANKKAFVIRVKAFSFVGYKRAYRKMFRKANAVKPDALVLDLRGNGGGSLANSYKLLSYLLDSTYTQTLKTGIRNYPYRKYTRGNFSFRFTKFALRMLGSYKHRNDTACFTMRIKPNRRHHYSGKLYVLINGASFSASGLVSAYLKKRPNTVIVGEETGGAMEGCNAGITPYYTLPNTGIRVRMPAFRVVHDVSPEPTGHGVIPDIKIKYAIQDIFARRDLEMQKILELINSAQ